MRSIILAGLLVTSAAFAMTPATGAPKAQLSSQGAAAIEKALEAPRRSVENRARDRWRHPSETLSFFGVEPNMTVVEIWPGRGWYSEILAPYLVDKGLLYLAAPAGRYGEQIRSITEADRATFGKARIVVFPGGEDLPQGTADRVLTFRNAHNWLMAGGDTAANNFKSIFAMLKPGGILGVSDHRLPENADSALEKTSGYIKASTIKKLATEAGFEFVGESEVNANPKDTRDHPEGVWTLPPSLRLGDKDRAKYLAIGESDRMTLKFRKPAK